jgi:thymidylate synthase
VREIIAPTLRILDPTDRLYTSPVRSTPMKYLAGEFLWYFQGRNDVGFIAEYSSFWKQITNDRSGKGLEEGKVNSSYGHLLFGSEWDDAMWEGRPVSQWEWALRSMVKDPDTRQAIMHINRPNHQQDWVKDFPCTLSLQMLLRDGKVHCVAHMRSNDLVKGTTFDVPMFGFFQETFVHHLNALSGRDPVGLGHLTLVANSSHLYDRDLNLVKGMLEGGITSLGGSQPLYEPPFEMCIEDGEWFFRTNDHFSAFVRSAAGDRNARPAIGELHGIYRAMLASLD